MPSPFANDGTAGVALTRIDDTPAFTAGQIVHADDGHDYIYVQASAAVAAAAAPGTQVTITDPGFTAAAGAGGWYAPNSTVAPAGVAQNQYFWARRSAL